MKKLFLALSLLSTAAFAKTTAETCFSSTKMADSEIPAQLCMKDIGLYNNGDMEWITVYGGNMAGSYEITSSYDGKPQASLVLEQYEEGPCAYARTTRIILKLNKNFSSELSADTIQVAVEKETLRDSCHSYPESEEILFQKIK